MEHQRLDKHMNETEYMLRASTPIELGGRYLLRFCSERDIPKVIDLFDSVWQRESFRVWLTDILQGRHPNADYSDFVVVEDLTEKRLASLMGLISQTWSYRDVTLQCGQPEFIATHRDYRKNGFIKAQMGLLNKLSEARGELVQVVWGNPWMYRQFGYEYALEGLWDTHKLIRQSDIPQRTEKQVKRFDIRIATGSDYSFIRSLHENLEARSIIRADKSDEEWLFQLEGWTDGAHPSRKWIIIEQTDGSPIGFFSYHNEPDSGGFGVHQLELISRVSYAETLPELLQKMWDLASEVNRGRQVSDIKLYLGKNHPSYDSLPRPLKLQTGQLECLYVRVRDIILYLKHISPALNKNLASSQAVEYSGELLLSMFKDGIRIAIEFGRITSIEPWNTDDFWHIPAFPDLTLLQLMFGRRRCKELSDIYVDCNIDPESSMVLDALFPSFKGTMWLGN